MILAVIPARFASTRFPGKPLVDIQGKSMIQRVYEQTCLSKMPEKVVVATDDTRIFDAVKNFGGEVVMTAVEHQSGTDRCAEVAKLFPAANFILNVQGDEPFIQPQQIDLLALTLTNPPCQIATLVKKISDETQLKNPNVVKAVLRKTNLKSQNLEAIYFSRHAIPYLRGESAEGDLARHSFYKHIGLYGFSRKTLLKLAKLAPSSLEKAESLEQLRWLENGFRVLVGVTEFETFGVDLPEDLLRF